MAEAAGNARPTVTTERAAQIAYEAYVFSDNIDGPEDGRVKSWDRLEHRERQAWVEVAVAVRSAVFNGA